MPRTKGLPRRMQQGRSGRSGRRTFLQWLAGLGLIGAIPRTPVATPRMAEKPRSDAGSSRPLSDSFIGLFLCGDVMTGRAIDQALPHPGDPRLYEPYVRDARRYLQLAEEAHGPIEVPLGFTAIWGDALEALERLRPDVRLINLETAVTASEDAWPGKGIHYRMHPRNLPALRAAGVHCCNLANNHVLDWGYAGLAETLASLRRAGIATVGAGKQLQEACAPAFLDVPHKGRVIVLGLGHGSSGIPGRWAAQSARPGVCSPSNLSERTVETIARRVHGLKRPGDVLVVSIHWGGNWGYEVPNEHRRFAHGLVDEAGVDLVHGHSSHHVKGIEVYRGRLILYGCGDFLNDYEGIGGYETYRGDLSLMYFPTLDPSSGRLASLRMIPTQVRRFRVNLAGEAETDWLRERLIREGEPFGTRVESVPGYGLSLAWAS